MSSFTCFWLDCQRHNRSSIFASCQQILQNRIPWPIRAPIRATFTERLGSCSPSLAQICVVPWSGSWLLVPKASNTRLCQISSHTLSIYIYSIYIYIITVCVCILNSAFTFCHRAGCQYFLSWLLGASLGFWPWGALPWICDKITSNFNRFNRFKPKSSTSNSSNSPCFLRRHLVLGCSWQPFLPLRW